MGFLALLNFVKSPLFRNLLLFVACAAAYWWFAYLPTYHHGYNKAHAEQQVVIDRLTGEREAEVADKNKRIAELEASAVQSAQDYAQQNLLLSQQLRNVLTQYKKDKAAFAASVPANAQGKRPGVDVPLIEDGKYYAPIETAGLSKPGVETVNRYLQELGASK